MAFRMGPNRRAQERERVAAQAAEATKRAVAKHEAIADALALFTPPRGALCRHMEAARVHRGARRRGCMAVGGAGAAGDARMAVDVPIDVSKHSKTKRFKSR